MIAVDANEASGILIYSNPPKRLYVPGAIASGTFRPRATQSFGNIPSDCVALAPTRKGADTDPMPVFSCPEADASQLS